MDFGLTVILDHLLTYSHQKVYVFKIRINVWLKSIEKLYFFCDILIIHHSLFYTVEQVGVRLLIYHSFPTLGLE
jgi:hypothetical protein